MWVKFASNLRVDHADILLIYLMVLSSRRCVGVVIILYHNPCKTINPKRRENVPCISWKSRTTLKSYILICVSLSTCRISTAKQNYSNKSH